MKIHHLHQAHLMDSCPLRKSYSLAPSAADDAVAAVDAAVVATLMPKVHRVKQKTKQPWMLTCMSHLHDWPCPYYVHSISFETLCLSRNVPFTFCFAVKAPSSRTRLTHRNHLQICRRVQRGRWCNSTWRASAWGSTPQWEMWEQGSKHLHQIPLGKSK